MNNKMGFLTLAAMFHYQRRMGINPFEADNQGPPKKNGGRPMFKQNRRAQIKANRRK